MDVGKDVAVGYAGFGEMLPSLLVTTFLMAIFLGAALYFFDKRDI